MKNKTPQAGWWGKGAAFAVVIALGGIAAAPYLIAATKTLRNGEELTVKKVVSGGRDEMKKKKSEHERMKDSEVKAAAWSADGQFYVGGKSGLAILKDDKRTPVAGFPSDEVKSVACAADGAVWVAGKKGLYALRDGKWSVEKKGDMFSVNVGPGGHVVAAGKRGVYSRNSAGEWSELVAAPPEEKNKDHEKDDQHEEH